MTQRRDLYAHFVNAIFTLCDHFNASIISWHRTPKHNQDVGGHRESLHLFGLAADLTFDTPDDQQRGIRYAERNGLWYEPKTNAVHFQALPPKPQSNAP